MKRFLVKNAIRKVDLFLCVGKMEGELLKEIYPDTRSIVIYPFIEEERYNKLLKLSVKASFNYNILFIGNGPDFYYKDLDFIILR